MVNFMFGVFYHSVKSGINRGVVCSLEATKAAKERERGAGTQEVTVKRIRPYSDGKVA